MLFKINYFKNKVIMKTTKAFKRFLSELTLWVFVVTTINPVPAIATYTSDKIIYPLKQVSILDCRFTDFAELSSDCKQDLPVLNTKDYKKYATKNWGYNDYTRTYTMLWWASYKYGWDIWNGGHIWTDIATSKWTPVYAMADWKVIYAKNDISLWNFITIEHIIKWKKIVSTYAHLSAMTVKAWANIKVWTKIWEVWSTWNSTWNHLHFQIDLTAPFHPYYYDYNKCPFSYYDITENGVCFDELAANTIDPLLFLETEWAVLDSIKSKTVSSNVPNYTNTNSEDLSIFDKTVYIWYSESDIKEVQEIFKKMWVYKGDITWDYSDIESTIISYQLSNNLISTSTSEWAGWFGPKTRFTAKKDYLAFINNGTSSPWTVVEYENNIQTEKIEKTSLMSREEIEKKEVEDFLRFHNLELNFVNEWWNIKKWTTETLKLKITNKRNGREFKWEMPWGMTFIVNTQMVSVFPEKLFYFTDWKRDILLTWIKDWNTNLYVKIWAETVKTFPLKVYNGNVTIYPETSKVYSSSKTTLWGVQTWIILFKDASWKSLINLEYGSTYKIKASNDNKICIKEGSIKNIRNIYSTTNCKEEDYKNEHNFTYKNTVWWLLIFDYKATSADLTIKVTNNYNNKLLSEKKILVSNPKGLNNTYAYKDEVIAMLKNWVVDWINKWYFLEDRWLTQKDALNWIKNALYKIQDDVNDNKTKQIVTNNIAKINTQIPIASKITEITRIEFLNLTNAYLVFDTTNTWKVEYKDVDDATSQKLSKVFDKNTTWKDQFGEKYFRPDTKITRWEWAFFIAKTLEKTTQAYLTLK